VASGEQLRGGVRLGHVVVRAAVEGGDLALVCALRGEHDDRDVGPLPDAAADVEAVDVGQSEVEDHRGRVLGGAPVECFLAVHGGDDVVAAGP
jgi:hypothetical protein